MAAFANLGRRRAPEVVRVAVVIAGVVLEEVVIAGVVIAGVASAGVVIAAGVSATADDSGGAVAKSRARETAVWVADGDGTVAGGCTRGTGRPRNCRRVNGVSTNGVSTNGARGAEGWGCSPCDLAPSGTVCDKKPPRDCRAAIGPTQFYRGFDAIRAQGPAQYARLRGSVGGRC